MVTSAKTNGEKSPKSHLNPAHDEGHNCLLGVEPVLGLVEDDAVRAVYDIIGDFFSPLWAGRQCMKM